LTDRKQTYLLFQAFSIGLELHEALIVGLVSFAASEGGKVHFGRICPAVLPFAPSITFVYTQKPSLTAIDRLECCRLAAKGAPHL
jgi:hypothetical protein